MGFDIEKLVSQAENDMREVFASFDEIAYKNTAKILDAFRENRVSEAHLGISTGYGYGDIGRDTLDKIYTSVFGAKAPKAKAMALRRRKSGVGRETAGPSHWRRKRSELQALMSVFVSCCISVGVQQLFCLL